MPRPPRHSVYVVLLDPEVIHDRRFAAANPQHRRGNPCVYVGMTGLTPDQRFANHRSGVRANRYVKRYGLRLERSLYRHLNPMTYRQAQEWEEDLAQSLRRRGYAVWQN